jgi:cob(I)alamin adenosyltransferase
MILKHGVIQIYTGNGKGKTTAAIGQGIRAAGAELRVYMIQFMKGYPYSEVAGLKNIKEFTVKQFGRADFVNKKHPLKVDIDEAVEALNHAKKIIKSNEYDVVILDEINVALDYKLININDVLTLIKDKPQKVELILTGRYASEELIAHADLVTEMLDIKHPYKNGMKCRKGIDY